MVGIDLIGPFKRTVEGNKWIILATDYFTKYVETKTLRTSNTWESAKFFVEQIVCRHGSPNTILSDRNSNFCSRLAGNIFSIVSTKHVRTAAYHPQCNGLTERANKTFATMLAKQTNFKQDDWDNSLPSITLAYNTSVQESTGYAPSFLTYARDIKLPFDLVFSADTRASTSKTNIFKAP